MRPTVRRLSVLTLMLSVASATASLGDAPPVAAAATIAQMVGQKLVVSMSGTTPDATLLGRIERGEIGGVILFGANITDARSLRRSTADLQHAAAVGGRPPLLIVTDQEGGTVRRVPWAPPTLSVPRMGQLGSAATASAQGRSTGYVLRCAGIDGDLAPVADVPGSTGSFLYQQGRTWSFDSGATATLSDAFAVGLGSGGDVAAMKHFPGIGLAAQDTDSHVVTITASVSTLAHGLAPYQRAIADGIPLIMLSNATYPAYDASNAAGWSRAISVDLLRASLGFRGATITDSLSGTAAARGVSATSLAIKAAQAGTDMILVTGSESSTASTYAGLLAAAQAGTIPLTTLQHSYDRILSLKSTIKAPVADATAPKVAAPVSRLVAPATLGSTSVPVRTSWSASDPCGVSGYLPERRAGGASWLAEASATSTFTSFSQALAVGGSYRYRVDATDGAGNTSGWAYGPTFVAYLRQTSSPIVKASSGWSTVSGTGYSGGSIRYASTAGAWMSYTFSGTSIGWVGAVGPTRGSARVYVDGAYRATIDLHSASAGLRRVVYAASWPVQGTHTVRIVVVGTAGHPRVDVDAFVRLYQP